MSTFIGVVGALIAYGVIVKLSSQSFRVFTTVAVIVLLQYFILPVLLQKPVSMMICLNLTHITIAVIAIYLLSLHRKVKAEA